MDYQQIKWYFGWLCGSVFLYQSRLKIGSINKICYGFFVVFFQTFIKSWANFPSARPISWHTALEGTPKGIYKVNLKKYLLLPQCLILWSAQENVWANTQNWLIRKNKNIVCAFFCHLTNDINSIMDDMNLLDTKCCKPSRWFVEIKHQRLCAIIWSKL